MIQQHVCHTARRRLWRAACGEREARVAAGAAVGASGLGTLWSVVTATSAEERLGDKPLCAPHSPAQAATTCSLLGAGSQGGGALALLGAKRAGPAVECGRRHEHREERLGASPWCAAQPGAGCGVQLVRSGKPEGRWSCWVREGCVRCGARSPLLRIAACDRRAGPWLRAAHHRNEDAFLSIVSRYRPLSPRGYPEVRCASCHSLLCAADTPLDIASSGRIRESNGTTFPTHRTSYGPP